LAKGGGRQRKLEVAAAAGASRKLQQQPVKAGGCSTSRAEGSKSGASRQFIAGLAGGRIVRRKSDGSPPVDRKCVTAGENRRFATGRAERSNTDPSRGSRPPVEPELRAVDASRRFLKPAQPEDAASSASWKVGLWGSWRTLRRTRAARQSWPSRKGEDNYDSEVSGSRAKKSPEEVEPGGPY